MLQCLNPCQLHHYFVDFVNMKCMSWFTFLHLEKMELCFVLFCFVLLVKEVKVFYLNDPPFCFWCRNIDMSNFCVGLVGGGRDGWGKLRSEPRAAHVFFIFQIKKELFIFIFQIKSISKGTFWKKGTKWQSLVNSPKVLSIVLFSQFSNIENAPSQLWPPPGREGGSGRWPEVASLKTSLAWLRLIYSLIAVFVIKSVRLSCNEQW